MDLDTQIRSATFDWLNRQEEIHGDVLSRKVLEQGFFYKGERITLVGPKGIWKPRMMKYPLSITTIFNGPYADSLSRTNDLQYNYRGNDPYHSDNVGLREAMKHRIPLIYFFALEVGRYLVTKPVFIVNDDINSLMFTVLVDNNLEVSKEISSEIDKNSAKDIEYGRRAYLTSNMKIRLHQRSFRERVLRAYNNECSLCRLRHIELLDAAHIIADKEEEGLPIITNGLSLCKIHHAAFDQNILGISPDYKIKVRQDILEEKDGPLLKYGIQDLDNQKIILPKSKENWPDQFRLEERFLRFLNAI